MLHGSKPSTTILSNVVSQNIPKSYDQVEMQEAEALASLALVNRQPCHGQIQFRRDCPYVGNPIHGEMTWDDHILYALFLHIDPM